MKNFAKTAVRILCFALVLLVLLFSASLLFEPKSNTKEGGMLDSTANGILSEPKNTIDVLIIGDSEAYSAFIPLKIWKDHGFTSYVCATSAQILCYSYEFLEKTFQNQSPKVVMLETNAIYRSFTYSDVVLQKLSEKLSVFRYHNRWKTLKFRDLTFGVDLSNTEVNKGYIFSNKVSPANPKGYMRPTEMKENFPEKNRVYVEKIKKLCEQKGAKLVLVSTPSVKNWNMRKHNAINELSNRLGCDYVDMNMPKNKIHIDWASDTRDRGDHMNFDGAKKVSAFLGGYFEKLGLFEDKRAGGDYSDWNGAVKTFTESIGKEL